MVGKRLLVLFAATALLAAACGGGPSPSPTTPPSATGQSPRTEWSVVGVLTDHGGLPIYNVKLHLWVETNREVYSGWGETDIEGRYAIVTQALPGDGYVLASTSFYLQEKFPFTYRTDVTVDARMTRIVRIVLKAPASLRVGETIDIVREIHVDDGRVLTDNGYNPALATQESVYSNDPAILQVLSGTGAVKRARAVAPGTTNLVTRFNGVYGRAKIRVE